MPSADNPSGKYPTYLRAPYTDCTTESGCRADMKALGYHLVHYDLTTEDYLHPGRDQIQQSKDRVKEAMAKAPEDGSLLTLQHDTIPQSNGNLTEFILQLAKEKGWEGMSYLSSFDEASSFHATMVGQASNKCIWVLH
jgi:uncharacterized protein YihD (DUF1040 family)